jgi:tetratricopeptide (TPR) repeat protein
MYDVSAQPELLDHVRLLDSEEAWRDFVVGHPNYFEDERLLTWLKAESERFYNVDPHASLLLASGLRLAAELTGRRHHEHLGLLAMGDALRCLGRYQESVTILDQAGAAFLADGDQVGWARTRIGWLFSSHVLGHGEAALQTLDPARAVLIEHGEWLRAAGLDLNAAAVCYELGRYQESLALYDRAEQTFRQLGEEAEVRVAWTKANRGQLLTFLGDFHTALRAHEDARQIFVRHGDTMSVMRQDQNIALVHAMQGYFTLALQRYSAALAAAEDAELSADAGWIMLNMVECYLSLNRHREALVLAEEAVSRFTACNSPPEVGKARFYCALAQAQLGNVDDAHHLLNQAADAFSRAGLAVREGTVMAQRARLFLDEGNWIAARTAAGSARAIFAERGLVIREAQADLVLARAALELGDTEEAAGRARSVLTTSVERDVGWLTYESHHVLGRAAAASGDLENAIDQFEHAVSSIERVQAALAIDLRTNFLADKLPVYEDAIATALALGDADRALAYLERAKSRALVDYLANHMDIQVRARTNKNPELEAALTQLRAEHNALYARRYGGDALFSSEIADDSHLQAEIRDRERQIERLAERLTLARTEGIAPCLADPGEFRLSPDLGPGTVLVEYFSTADRGAAFVVKEGRVQWVSLPAGAAEIRRSMVRWHLNLAATSQALARGADLRALQRGAVHILGTLYRLLIEPVRALIDGSERLVVVPYGPMHGVPFHALHDGRRFLLECMEVSSSPSGRFLALCRNAPRRSAWNALVVAHTNEGRLPHVLEEAAVVSREAPGECFVEEQATRAALLRAAPSHTILHIAAHAEARLDNPTFAHIQLADGQLSTVDIFNLDLTGALVTLSACETGRSMVMGGDELIGLTRGFLYAGVSTLVHSLWQVEDRTSAELMTVFYRALREGWAAGAALRQAQLGMLRERSDLPFLWAPFQITGHDGWLRGESEASLRPTRRREE